MVSICIAILVYLILGMLKEIYIGCILSSVLFLFCALVCLALVSTVMYQTMVSYTIPDEL